SPRSPCPADPPDLCSADRVCPPQAAWLPPSAFARRCRLQIVHLAHANFTNIAGSHSQFKYSTAGRVSYLTAESQFNSKCKHLKTLNPAGFSLILIGVGLAILGWAAWQMWHAEISTAALLVAHREMQAIAWVSDRFSQADVQVQRVNPSRVRFDQLVRLYRNIGAEFLYPAMAIVFGLAGLCFLRSGDARFRRVFDLEKLIAEQAKTSRSTAAFVGRKLKLSDVQAGDPRPADPALHG